MKQVSNCPPAPRRSACADAALQAEIRRVEKMTIEERARAALEMAKGFPTSGSDGKTK